MVERETQSSIIADVTDSSNSQSANLPSEDKERWNRRMLCNERCWRIISHKTKKNKKKRETILCSTYTWLPILDSWHSADKAIKSYQWIYDIIYIDWLGKSSENQEYRRKGMGLQTKRTRVMVSVFTVGKQGSFLGNLASFPNTKPICLNLSQGVSLYRTPIQVQHGTFVFA